MSEDATAKDAADLTPRIRVSTRGPYLASGKITLTVRTPRYDERGEPVEWIVGEKFPERPTYVLCRCGHSGRSASTGPAPPLVHRVRRAARCTRGTAS